MGYTTRSEPVSLSEFHDSFKDMVRISGKATKELYHKKSQHVSICQYGTQTLYYKYGPVKYFLSFLSDSPNLRRAHGTSVNKEME